MQIISGIDWFLEVLNDALDVALPWIGLALVAGYIANYLRRNFQKQLAEIEKDGKPKYTSGEIITQALILVVLATLVCLVFWLVPKFAGNILRTGWVVPALRWLGFLVIVLIIAYIYGHENGENRWRISAIGHVAILFFGWIVDRWMGILFISVPLIFMFYFMLHELSHIILPVSNPEDKKEKWKRFSILAAFAWGFQLPILVVGEHAWKKPEVRIPGAFARGFLVPGLIWTKTHQVVGVTGGTQFKRVDGPGVVFTGRLERPFQVVDLRLQLRSNEIDVVSKDGISFKAVVFTAFRIDPESWDKDTYDKLWSLNPILRGANKPDYTVGSFPFSHARVLAALSTTSSRATEADSTLFWDQWALNVIENVSRKVVSQKDLDELWIPSEDEKGLNALSMIAQEIKENALLTLQAAGILLYVARIVNFSFPPAEGKADEISKQHIASWGSVWTKKRGKILAEARAESERTQQEARAYAESLLLTSIAEGLQKTQEMHPRLPRYVIAMRFLSALQDYIHKSPDDDKENSESQKKISELQNYIRNFQNTYLPGKEKE